MSLDTKKRICGAIGLLFVLFIFLASATPLLAVDYVPLQPLVDPAGAPIKTDLPSYLQGMYRLAIGAAGVLAVIMITVGGIKYMSTDAIGHKSDAKETITNAIGGLVLALMSFVILNSFNPELVKFNLDFGPKLTNEKGAFVTPGHYESLYEPKRLDAELAEQKQWNANRIRSEIETLETQVKNGVPLSEEQQAHLKELEVIRQGTVIIERMWAPITAAGNLLQTTSDDVGVDKIVSRSISDLQSNILPQIKTLETSGADPKQLETVKRKLNDAEIRIKNCGNLRKSILNTQRMTMTRDATSATKLNAEIQQFESGCKGN